MALSDKLKQKDGEQTKTSDDTSSVSVSKKTQSTRKGLSARIMFKKGEARDT